MVQYQKVEMIKILENELRVLGKKSTSEDIVIFYDFIYFMRKLLELKQPHAYDIGLFKAGYSATNDAALYLARQMEKSFYGNG